ncbi:MAG TPA: (5-formylfuran-3-yl)methyl phosphate synthase [Azospirillum sp.]|nr:(5-formylfuran-3-yl)methyl phosphate synthase [Azospirillum sp.]
MTRLLASVADLDELALAAEGGADILDLKDPTAGALGAWAPERIAEAVALTRAWPHRPPLSATVGDLPMAPAVVTARVAETWALGVDFVKIGLAPDGNPDGDPAACVTALAAQARRGARLVAVLFADLWPDDRLLDDIARAGFSGAMLDTAGKASGGLLRHKDTGAVARFVDGAHRRGLLTGLAGSLTLADVPALLPLGPDYLGFRTALCAGGDRRGVLDPTALAAVRLSIPPDVATVRNPAWTAAGTPSNRPRPG